MTSPAAPSTDPLTQPGPWNTIAVGYDEEFFNKLPSFMDDVVTIVKPAASATVLDVGTGPGTAAVRLAPLVARVVAIDFAEQMIERLRRHTSDAGIQNVEAHVMDGQALTFSDASFDAVISMFGWFLFGDRARSAKEMHRVLKPGGRVLVSSWATAERNRVLGAGLEAIRAALPELPRPPGPLPTQIPEVCAQELRDAGFGGVTTKVVAAQIEFSSVDEYWRMMDRASAPFVVLEKKLGPDAFRAAKEKALAYLRAQYGGGSFVLGTEAIFTSGLR